MKIRGQVKNPKIKWSNEPLTPTPLQQIVQRNGGSESGLGPNNPNSHVEIG